MSSKIIRFLGVAALSLTSALSLQKPNPEISNFLCTQHTCMRQKIAVINTEEKDGALFCKFTKDNISYILGEQCTANTILTIPNTAYPISVLQKNTPLTPAERLKKLNDDKQTYLAEGPLHIDITDLTKKYEADFQSAGFILHYPNGQ